MTSRRCLVLAAWLFTAALARAAPADRNLVVAASDPRHFSAFLAGCRARYAAVDRLIDRAGVRDAGYFRVPGYPYLRTDRFLSSYRTELDSLDKFGAWMLQLREYDSLAREDELTNLGMPKIERASLLSDLRLCAVWLSFAELNDPQTRSGLSEAAWLGGQAQSCDRATATPVVVRARRRAVAADFAQPGAPAPVLWRPASSDESVAADLLHARHDELDRVGLPMGDWAALAAAHAPSLLLDRDGAADALGMPQLAGTRATVDPARPVVHYLIDYARVGGRTLVQIEYFLWFRSPHADVDGLIWRVTLDQQGRPLLYASIRVDGRDPMWFPVRGLWPRAADAEAAPQMPQIAPAGPYALQLRANSHRLVKLVPLDDGTVSGESRDYLLRPYEELLMLPDGKGGTHSLFDPRGVVRGAASVHSCPAGEAARQWGHHPISIGGHLYYFDDPYLIEKLFVY